MHYQHKVFLFSELCWYLKHCMVKELMKDDVKCSGNRLLPEPLTV